LDGGRTPLLRAAKKEFEKEQARERGDVLCPLDERGNPDDGAAALSPPHGRDD